MSSILDLVITNEEGMVENTEYLSLLRESYHIMLGFDFICHINQTCKDKEKYCYEKENYERSRRDLAHINWNSELQRREKDVNVQCTFIKD